MAHARDLTVPEAIRKKLEPMSHIQFGWGMGPDFTAPHGKVNNAYNIIDLGVLQTGQTGVHY